MLLLLFQLLGLVPPCEPSRQRDQPKANAVHSDLLRGLFFCFALGALVNVYFVLGNSPELVLLYKGYPGYFNGKNYLGEFAAVIVMLSLYECLQPGRRRVLGIIFLVIATTLLLAANSKTAIVYPRAAP